MDDIAALPDRPKTVVDEADPLLPTTHTPSSKTRHPPQNNDPTSTELYGYIIMIMSTIATCFTTLFHRLSFTRFNFPLIPALFIRSSITTSVSVIYLIFSNKFLSSLSITKRQWFLVFLHGIIGGACATTVFYVIPLLSSGDYMAILFTSPIFTMIFANFFLSEPISPTDALAAFLSFLGVILLTHSPSTGSHSSVFVGKTVLGVVLTLCIALGGAITHVIVRSEGTNVHFMLFTFSSSVTSLFVALCLDGVVSKDLIVHNPWGFVMSCVAGLCATFGIAAINLALAYCRAGPGLLIRNIDLPLVYVLGMIFLNEVPRFLAMVGAGLIFISAVIIGLGSFKQRR